MKDRLEDLVFYKEACTLYDLCWEDCNALSGDFRGREIATQLIRSAGSIAANIKEGYGRGFGKEYPNFLRYSRASARETMVSAIKIYSRFRNYKCKASAIG